MDWNWRKEKLVFEFGLWSPDILCLQEVDNFTDLEQAMATRGYDGIWKMRTGNATDGCAIFWRTARFQLRYKEDIEFNKLDLRDNVAQICVLESVTPGNMQTESSPSHPQQAKQIVVCNTHVLYNPKRGDIKLGQVRTLLDRAYTISKTWNDSPVIICGDFNSTPKSPLYNFMLEQKLNLSGLAKSTISGQQTNTSQGLYTGSNTSRFYPPFPTTNGRDGSITCPNDHKPQPEARNMTENSLHSSRESTLTNTASDSCLNSESSRRADNNVPCSGSTNPHEQELSGCVEGPTKDAHTSDAEAHNSTTNGEEIAVVNNSSEGYGVIKKGPVEETNITEFPSPMPVYDEIVQSASIEIVDRSCLLSSYESSEPKDSGEKSAGGSNNHSKTLEDFPDHVISEKATCAFDGNNVQSDTQFDKSKYKTDEHASEPMSNQNNCTPSESGSTCFSDSLKFADTLHQMSTLKLEENKTESTHLASPLEPSHHTDCAFSDTCGSQCTIEMINKHSESHSCSDDFGNRSHAFEGDGKSNEVVCPVVNSDPSFFDEFSGVNESLLEDEGQRQTTSDGSSARQLVTSDKRYYNYDPYRWMPDEIKAATGNEECTFVEHNMKIRSVYTEVEDFEGTKDANKEPLVTSYNRKFMGTVDYIWVSEDLQPVQVLDTFPKEILKQTVGFPTKKWGSDHIALVCELAFTK
uniref:Endonuclease/exonuclease/phosphatase domain-containing protein n=2 Tax=Oryza brachyantha TaxID=4533 RepID=J3L1T2_ORYBR